MHNIATEQEISLFPKNVTVSDLLEAFELFWLVFFKKRNTRIPSFFLVSLCVKLDFFLCDITDGDTLFHLRFSRRTNSVNFLDFCGISPIKLDTEMNTTLAEQQCGWRVPNFVGVIRSVASRVKLFPTHPLEWWWDCWEWRMAAKAYFHANFSRWEKNEKRLARCKKKEGRRSLRREERSVEKRWNKEEEFARRPHLSGAKWAEANN